MSGDATPSSPTVAPPWRPWSLSVAAIRGEGVFQPMPHSASRSPSTVAPTRRRRARAAGCGHRRDLCDPLRVRRGSGCRDQGRSTPAAARQAAPTSHRCLAAGSSGSTREARVPRRPRPTSSASTPSTACAGRETEQGAGHSAHPRFVTMVHMADSSFDIREQGRHDGDPERAQAMPRRRSRALRLHGPSTPRSSLGREGRHEGELGRPRQGECFEVFESKAHQAQRAAQVSGCRKPYRAAGVPHRGELQAGASRARTQRRSRRSSATRRRSRSRARSRATSVASPRSRATTLQATMALLRGKRPRRRPQFVNFR